MVPVIAAQAEQLLPVETDRVGAAGFSQGVELPVDRGESDMFATVFQLAVQLLRGDEFVAAVQRVADGVFLAGLPHDMFTHYL